MLNPGLQKLLRFQLAARFARACERFRRPRRLLLSVSAVFLALLWLGQAIAGILYRQPADPDRLMIWISMAFAAYAAWHFLKAVVRPPVEPFEWTAAETEFLGSAPLSRPELVRYRLAGILLPAGLKAFCFALVMIPDLQIVPAGFLGMFLALVFLDLVRMSAEIVTYGVSRPTFRLLRFGALSLTIALALRILVVLMARPGALNDLGTLAMIRDVIAELTAMAASTWGQWLLTPFIAFARLTLAPDFGWQLAWDAVVTVAIVLGLMGIVVRLDGSMWKRRIERERRELSRRGPRAIRGEEDSPPIDASAGRSPWRIPVSLGGAGSLAWRHAWGVRKYEVGVLMSLFAPGVLSLLPLMGNRDAPLAAFQMIGSLVFYSLVLLPAAFKFDFRRDLDRLVVLKALPMRPTAVVLGQLAVPVFLCTLFQLAIMLIAMSYRPFGFGLLAMAMGILALANCLIFALENLIFLLYPYRLNQEGIDIFLRSIIVLTGKTVLFGLGLTVTLGWAFVAARWSAISRLETASIFLLGMSLTLLLCCGVLIALLTRVYHSFDPSQDGLP